MDESLLEGDGGEVVDLAFRVTGESVPVDHGYLLYSAVCSALPEVHAAAWLGIHPLDGEPMGSTPERLRLRPRGALKLRAPAARIAELLRISGRTLMVGSAPLRLGPPTIFALEPAGSVDARAVHIRLTEAPRRDNPDLDRPTLDMPAMKAATVRELERQLGELGVSGSVELLGKRTLTIGAQRLVTFSTRVSGLEPEASLLLQARGLGGKRAMGCGIFRPTRGQDGRG